MNPIRKNWRSRLILALVAFALAYIGYTYRYAIRAALWHWRHGSTVTVAGYIVPVPSGWLVQPTDDSGTVFLLDTRRPIRPYPVPLSNSVIVIQSSPNLNGDLERKKLEIEKSFQHMGLSTVDEHDVSTPDGPFTCQGGEAMGAYSHTANSLISLMCVSAGPIDAWFNGPRSRVPEFLNILSKLRKT